MSQESPPLGTGYAETTKNVLKRDLGEADAFQQTRSKPARSHTPLAGDPNLNGRSAPAAFAWPGRICILAWHCLSPPVCPSIRIAQVPHRTGRATLQSQYGQYPLLATAALPVVPLALGPVPEPGPRTTLALALGPVPEPQLATRKYDPQLTEYAMWSFERWTLPRSPRPSARLAHAGKDVASWCGIRRSTAPAVSCTQIPSSGA